MKNNQRKKNVLCILPTIHDCGGMEAFYFNYYEHFSKKISVDFITHSLDSEKYESMIKNRGDSVFVMPPFSFKNLFKIKEKFTEVVSKKQYDVVHCNMANAAFLYLRLAQKYGIPLRILHSHQDRYASRIGHSIRNIPLVLVGKKYANKNLACSKKAGEFLFGSKDYQIIYNAVDISRYRYSDKNRKMIRSRLGIKSDEKLIGCVGRLDKQKNQKFAIEIIRAANDQKLKLVLIGDGSDKEWLEGLIEKYGLKEQIKILKPTNEIEKYYSAFDLLLMPSIYEGLGMVAVEAQLSGCPVLASTRIPEEAKISEHIKYLSLKACASDWKDALYEFTTIDRFSEAQTSLYDILEQVHRLDCIYGVKND